MLSNEMVLRKITRRLERTVPFLFSYLSIYLTAFPEKRRKRHAEREKKTEKNRQTGVKVGDVVVPRESSSGRDQSTSTKVLSRVYCGLLLDAEGPYRG